MSTAMVWIPNASAYASMTSEELAGHAAEKSHQLKSDYDLLAYFLKADFYHVSPRMSSERPILLQFLL
jgi:hypothetical protein